MSFQKRLKHYDNKALAESVYKEKTVVKHLRTWTAKYAKLLKKEYLAHLAEKCVSRFLATPYWVKWRKQHLKIIKKDQVSRDPETHKNSAAATHFYTKTSLSKVFESWKLFAKIYRVKSLLLFKARSHYNRRLCGGILTNWNNYTARRMTLYLKHDKISERTVKTQKSLVFSAFSTFTRTQNSLRFKSFSFLRINCAQQKRSLFAYWRAKLGNIQNLRVFESVVETLQLARSLLTLKSYAARQSEISNQISLTHQRATVKSLFSHWRLHCSRSRAL